MAAAAARLGAGGPRGAGAKPARLSRGGSGARGSWKQRDHLFVFLDEPGVDPTNNLAERQLRPAVIRRKLSSGNKTRSGARTFEVLASVAATYRQRGEDFLQLAQASARLRPA